MRLLADSKSHFSMGESILTPEDIAEQAAAAGYGIAALCDTMTISGMPDFTRACDKHGIKPVIGVRLRIVETLDRVDKQYTAMPKLYILSDEGFGIITRLLTLANDDEHFYRVPRLIWQDVLDALQDARGHVAYSSGSLYSASRRSDAVDMLRDISALLERSQTLAEFCPGNSAVWDRQAEFSYRVAAELDIPVLLSRPVLYAKENGHRVMEFMTSIVNNHKRNYGYRFESVLTDYRATPTRDLMAGAVEQAKRVKSWAPDIDTAPLRFAMKTWQELCDAVTFKWHKLDVSLPKMADDEDAALWAAAKKGLAERLRSTCFGHKVDPKDHPAYIARLKYEMDVLTAMGFSGYFLLTQDIVQWSKQNGVLVGPGRGSVGGSIVAWVLGITDVDPIRFGLIFERFINPERIDLPDADLDFMSTRRHEVIERIRRDYGEDRVAGISNFATLGSRAALNDLSRILDDVEGQQIGKFVPVEQGTAIPLERACEEVAEIKAFAKKKPELWEIARDIEGKMRTLAVHAAGVVVAGEPLVNRAVVERRKTDAVVNWDKRVVEDMGLVKMDILGLSTLDLIAIALRKIRERTGERVDLTAIPLDDPDVLQAFGEGKTIGVFQFESPGMRRLLKDIYKVGQTIAFEDVAAATALYRPGPMESGLMEDYVEIKQGKASEHYDHPSMQGALEETCSVIVYQEQVMRIAQDLCGFSMAQADHLRKAIGKKDAKKMEEQGGSFVDGAVSNGMEQATAQALWDKIVKFAGYAFNKSHAVAYTLISYQSMWLKVKYPVEFYAAALTILGDQKTPGLIKDAAEKGIVVSPPDVNYSTGEYEILTDTRLVAPFSVMKGLSARGASEIMAAREAGEFKSAKDFEDRVPRRVVNKTVRAKLDRVGAFARIEPQRPADHPDRRKDQLELVPTIMVGGAIVERDVNRDKDTKAEVARILDEFRANPPEEVGDAVFVLPRLGKRAKFMAVFDGPGYHDEQAGQFARADSFEAVKEALDEVGLDIQDGYWTGLCKTPKKKGEKMYSTDVIHAFKPLFEKELELLNPQVVICLGSNAARYFDPGMKGGITDHAGRVFYQKADDGVSNDRNVVIGITPGMIFFDPDKQTILNDAFRQVAEMLES